MTAYYNEFSSFPAQWLRNLVTAGHIAPGIVDDRSIKEVKPDDLYGHTQSHFFAGIGVWSYALRLAGWPDDREVWTGSCPCQPFSAAGKRGGTTDPRHLWPEWFRLIRECRPATIFGEQVSSSDGLAWLDIVCTDLESAGYAVGAFDLCAAGAGAPHIRQRLYFVAHANDQRGQAQRQLQRQFDPQRCCDAFALADAANERRGEAGSDRGRSEKRISDGGEYGKLGNSSIATDGTFYGQSRPSREQQEQVGGSSLSFELGDASSTGCEEQRRERNQPARPASSSFWSDLEWLPCRDGKARPTKPGLFPLAARSPGRVGRLRAYGNSIVAPLAAEFVRAYMERD